MYTSTFTFAKRQYDEAFYQLDAAIAKAAKEIPGYLGEETWENPAAGLISNVYYWDSLDSLQALMKHPDHLQAKQAQANWLDGYQVVISTVIGSYGDGKLSHPTSAIGISPVLQQGLEANRPSFDQERK